MPCETGITSEEKEMMKGFGFAGSSAEAVGKRLAATTPRATCISFMTVA